MAKEEKNAARLLHRFSTRVQNADTPNAVASIVAEAQALVGTEIQDPAVLPGILLYAIERAYILDPNATETLQIEKDWISASESAGSPVGPHLVAHKRREAAYWKVLRPMALEHEALVSAAQAPTELLRVLRDVTEEPPAEMDRRFVTAALSDAYAAAWLLNPDDPATLTLAEALEKHVGPGFAETVSKEASREQRRRQRQRR